MLRELIQKYRNACNLHPLQTTMHIFTQLLYQFRSFNSLFSTNGNTCTARKWQLFSILFIWRVWIFYFYCWSRTFRYDFSSSLVFLLFYILLQIPFTKTYNSSKISLRLESIWLYFAPLRIVCKKTILIEIR